LADVYLFLPGPFGNFIETMTGQEKLKKIREELRQTFLERLDLIDGALAALLSSHHLLMPPH
jgi:MoxR-like ATPase